MQCAINVYKVVWAICYWTIYHGVDIERGNQPACNIWDRSLVDLNQKILVSVEAVMLLIFSHIINEI